MRQRGENSNEGLRVKREALSHAVVAISESLSVLPLDLRSVLQTIVEQARQVAGAEYAALGIVEDPSRSFEPWVYSGVPLELAAAIGRYPRPVGLLGAVPYGGRTIRLRDLQKDARFHGFPQHHPEMHSFLGVPIRYRGQSVGNLYLANKVGAAEFSEEDQWAVELLAAHAGVALQVAGIDELRATVDAERARLQTILESAPNGVFYIDSESGLLVANRAAISLLGSAPDPKAGLRQYVGRVLFPDGRPASLEELPSSRALRGEVLRAEEYLLVRSDGVRIPMLVSAAPILSHEGGRLGAVVIFEDITPIKELEQLREEWASLIAHDLRQPVTVITSYADLLQRLGQRSGMGEREARALEHIGVAIRNLDRMIAELLDISRLEARRMTLEQQWVEPPELVRTVAERSRGVTGEHPVRVEVAGTVPSICADPGRLEQVLVNLLSNAAKYSYPNTEIRVELRSRDGEVQLSVTNEGTGIPPEELPQLFSRFHRTRVSREQGIAGLGLGLYISKGLVEAHGGSIWAESTLGKTTTFHMLLPTAGAACQAA